MSFLLCDLTQEVHCNVYNGKIVRIMESNPGSLDEKAFFLANTVRWSPNFIGFILKETHILVRFMNIWVSAKT